MCGNNSFSIAYQLLKYSLSYSLLNLVHSTGQDFTLAQRERAQEDLKVPCKVPYLTQPPLAYERQPQQWDHPSLFE